MFGTGQSDTKLEPMTQQQGIYIYVYYIRVCGIYTIIHKDVANFSPLKSS